MLEFLFTRFLAANEKPSDFFSKTTVNNYIFNPLNQWAHSSLLEGTPEQQKIYEKGLNLKNKVTEILWTVYNHEEIKEYFKSQNPNATEIETAQDLGERLFGYSNGEIQPNSNTGERLQILKQEFRQ